MRYWSMHELPPWSWDELLSELPPAPLEARRHGTKLIEVGVPVVELTRDIAAGVSRGCTYQAVYLANHPVKLDVVCGLRDSKLYSLAHVCG